VTFTKVLMIYHSESPPPSFSFIPLPHSWNSFNRSHFSIFIHENIIWPSHSSSHTLSLYPPPSNWYQPQTGPVLPSCPPCSWGKKRHFVCSRDLYKEFHCDISKYICIVSELVHLPQFSPFYLIPFVIVTSIGLKIL
jgi:hypothetical protein